MADETEIRVLVVDDEPVVLGLVTRLLERDGMAVEAVADGEQALARLRDPALRIDVAVVDATVGPRGAAEVLRALAALPRPVGVVVTSGGPLEADLQALLQAGAGVSLPKPFGPGALLAAVRGAREAGGA